MFRLSLSLILLISVCSHGFADPSQIAARYPEYAIAAAQSDAILTALGVTRSNTPLPALVTPELLDVTSPKYRVLVVLDERSTAKTRTGVLNDWIEFYTDENHKAARTRLTIGLVPVTHPDGSPSSNTRFPSDGTAYSDVDHPEALYLWRWIGMLAPDLVIVVTDGNTLRWNMDRGDAPNCLASALMNHSACDAGTVGAVNVEAPDGLGVVHSLLSLMKTEQHFPEGTAEDQLVARRRRSPVEVAEELSRVYGHQLPSVAYIPALALMGRLRLATLTGNEKHFHDVVRIVRPYIDGSKSSLGANPSGSTLSGHLIFGELAEQTGDREYVELTRAAADLGFDEHGKLRDAMPFHSEMSDAVFMGIPILVRTGRLTGESKYHDMAIRHLQFMLTLNLRSDGLHQHSPLDPAGTAWGRGNGFPALGLALALSDLPRDGPHHAEMLAEFRAHLTEMIRHQDEMGMWHQVVDHPESYREFTVTCMTTFAITRGLRNGWLDRSTFEPVVRRAWEAIKCRIGAEGRLVDVCTGTGKQKSFRDYLDRKAILGPDDRGGAMALMVSTELAFATRENSVELLDAGTSD
jgi:rhamnogalacturonyl hydrolase YesR